MKLTRHQTAFAQNALSLLEQARRDVVKIDHEDLGAIERQIADTYAELGTLTATEAPAADPLAVMSPATLASLILDVQAKSMGAEQAELDLERRSVAPLVAIVGVPEAESLIEAAAIATADRDRRQEATELERRRTPGDRGSY